ncbi:MAG: prepilin-type N-terminal cleavage/methylation domain-containing protein, partial [Bacilli bacterium]|nr:prepilin-type N-terminal cleavage/methylation domain-containing protein [Bacilli bacterium]
MKKEKGFTLIELLAVIVILAIIALIATPLIINIINEAQKGAFEDSSYAIIAAAEQGYAKGLIADLDMSGASYTYESGEISSSTGNVSLDYKGSSPESGILVINDEGNVAIAFYKNGYCTTKGYSDSKITTEAKTAEECTLPSGVEVPEEKYAESILNGSDPILEDGMIPIVYDETETRWEKADTSSTWYDYENQMWANVVLVTEDSRSSYQSAASGTTIDEGDILAYLVWIPRYEYETITSDVATQIKVNFISIDTTEASDNYIIHPAFTFGDEELSGIWVGKFETSTETTSTCYTSPSTDNCLDVNPMIVPNVSSLRNQTVSTMFTTIQKMNSVTYGLATGDA